MSVCLFVSGLGLGPLMDNVIQIDARLVFHLTFSCCSSEGTITLYLTFPSLLSSFPSFQFIFENPKVNLEYYKPVVFIYSSRLNFNLNCYGLIGKLFYYNFQTKDTLICFKTSWSLAYQRFGHNYWNNHDTKYIANICSICFVLFRFQHYPYCFLCHHTDLCLLHFECPVGRGTKISLSGR